MLPDAMRTTHYFIQIAAARPRAWLEARNVARLPDAVRSAGAEVRSAERSIFTATLYLL